jgi:hypothetical protein
MKRPRALALLIVALTLSGAVLAIAQSLPTIAEGAAPTLVHVPAMPTASLDIAEPGEYRIEATATTGDTELFLLQGDVVAAEDTTSFGSDARIVTFLDRGAYGVRIRDSRGRAIASSVSVARLAPLPPAATISPGDAPVTVEVPHGASIRESSAEVTLRITSAGTYAIDVDSPDADHDAEMHLIQGGALLQSDADSGEGTNARIIRALEPGEYTIRFHDYANRGGALVVHAAVQ